MTTAVINGLNTISRDIIISGSSLPRSRGTTEQLEVETALSRQKFINQSDLVTLGIEPQMPELVPTGLHFHQPVLSMAARVTLERPGKLTDPNLPLICIIPNPNARILKSTAAICTNDNVSAELLVTAKEITDSFGSAFDTPEKDFDIFTALAGFSPVYTYLFIEALAKVGVKHGISKEKSLDTVTQTILASAENLLQGSDSPHDLTDKISSPGGITIAGFLGLEETGLTASVILSIDAAIDKAEALQGQKNAGRLCSAFF